MHKNGSAKQCTTEDFDAFSPTAYLSQYHSNWDREDRFLMQFLHHTYKCLPPQKNLLEIGGGPTIYQLISARNKVEAITFTEFLKANRTEVRKWKYKDKAAFNWDCYFECVRDLEETSEDIESMKSILRAKLKSIIPSNILQEPCILMSPLQKYDIVSAHFCPESITSNREEFVLGMKNICSFVKREGFLVMSFLHSANLYAVGSVNFSACSVNEQVVEEVLDMLGCKVITVDSCLAAAGRDYAGTFSVLARRQ